MPTRPVPPGQAVSVSHVSQRGQRLACWLRSTDIRGLCPSPNIVRLSRAQDSKTAPVLPLIIITTCLSILRIDTRITSRKTPPRCPFRVELSASVRTFVLASRSRQSPLRPCAVSDTSAALRASRVRPFPACRGWDRPTLSLTGTQTPDSTGVTGHFLPVSVSVSPNPAPMCRLDSGRREHCSPQRPVTAAPAPLRARGYRGLDGLAIRRWALRPGSARSGAGVASPHLTSCGWQGWQSRVLASRVLHPV